MINISQEQLQKMQEAQKAAQERIKKIFDQPFFQPRQDDKKDEEK